MEPIISKEELDEFRKLTGKIRGAAFKATEEFILKEEGEEALKKLEDTIAELGYSIKYKDIRPTSFYPSELGAISILSIKRLFNYDDKKFQEMGRFGAKLSFILRLFLKYFVSLKRLAKEMPKMWRMYFMIGDLKVVEIDEEKKYMIGRIENFRLHPIHCQYLKGYLPGVIQMVVKSPVTCEEVKCIFRGDEYHEFLLKW